MNSNKNTIFIRSEAVSICTGWSQDGLDRIFENDGHFHKKPPLFKFPDVKKKSMAIGQGQLRSNEETVCSISWISWVRSALTPSWIHFIDNFKDFILFSLILKKCGHVHISTIDKSDELEFSIY